MNVFEIEWNQKSEQCNLNNDKINPLITEVKYHADYPNSYYSRRCNYYYVVVSLVFREFFKSEQHQIITER
jgi:hypothetical protein